MPYANRQRGLEYLREYNRTRRRKGKCIICGKSIAERSTYCPSCAVKGERNPRKKDPTKWETKKCLECGKEFETRKKKSNRFCSYVCLNNYHAKRKVRDIPMPLQLMSFLTGSLLGDGTLTRHKYSGLFETGCIKKDYIEWIRKQFESFGIHARIYKRDVSKNNKHYISYKLFTVATKQLGLLADEWYQSKKIIPKGIVLDPIAVRHWYIGDGCLKKQGSIVIATDCFTVDEVETLCCLLNKEGNFQARRQPCRNRVYIPVKATPDFIKYIEPCPTDSFQYKFREN